MYFKDLMSYVFYLLTNKHPHIFLLRKRSDHERIVILHLYPIKIEGLCNKNKFRLKSLNALLFILLQNDLTLLFCNNAFCVYHVVN